MRRRNVNPLTGCIDWSLDLVVDLSLDPPWSHTNTSHWAGENCPAGCVGRQQTSDHRGLIEETGMAIFIFTLTWV